MTSVPTNGLKAVKGQKKGGGSGGVPQEATDNLLTDSTAYIIDVVSEGEIAGWANPDMPGTCIFFDDTPLQNADGSFNFEGVEYWLRTGTPDQAPVPGFASVENEVAISTKVDQAVPVSRSVSNPEIDAVRVKVGVGAFLEVDDETGDRNETSIEFAIDLKVGAADWTEMVADTITGKTTSGYQRGYRVELPEIRPVTIRVRRITEDSDSSSLQNDLQFVSITEITDAKLQYPSTAYVALAVSAAAFGGRVPRRSYKLGGVICLVPSNYDPVSRTYDESTIWDGTLKKAPWCQNPAWITYTVLTEDRWGLGERVQPEMVDKWRFYQIGKYCDELIDNGQGGTSARFSINGVLNTREAAYSVISQLSAAWRGVTYWGAGAIVPVQDAPSDPVKLVTNATVKNGEFVYAGTARSARHTSAVVSFRDALDHYRIKALVSYDDPEAVERYGWRQTDITNPFCTSYSEAYLQAKWAVDTDTTQRETVNYVAGFDHAAIRPGDAVLIHDKHRVGVRAGGRIKAISADRKTVTLDAEVNLVAGENHGVSLATDVGGFVDLDISDAITGPVLDIVCPAGVPLNVVPGATFLLTATNLLPKRFKVLTNARKKHEWSITAVEEDPAKWARIEQGIDLDLAPSHLLPPVGPPAPPDVHALDVYRKADPGSRSKTRVLISWGTHADSRVVRYLVEVKEPKSAWRRLAPVTSNSVDVKLETGRSGNIRARVMAVTAIGESSAWAEVSTDTSTLLLAPSQPVGIAVTVGVETALVSWTPISFAEFRSVEVWLGQVNDVLLASRIGETSGSSFPLDGLLKGQEYWVWLRTTSHAEANNLSGFAVYGPFQTKRVSDLFDQGDLDLISEKAADTASGLIANYNADTVAPLEQAMVDAYGSLNQPKPLAARINTLNSDMDARVQDIDRIDTRLEFDAPVLRDADKSIDDIFAVLTDLRLAMRDTDKKLAKAGIYIDPVSGNIEIAGVQDLQGRYSEASLRIDGVQAEVAGKVTYAELTDFVFDGVELPELTDLRGRVSTVEFDMDGLDARFAAKSVTVTVSDQGVALAQALLDIDSLEQAIALRVTTDDFGALESRQTASEAILDTLDGANLSLSVVDVRTAQKDIEDIYSKLTGVDLDRHELKKDVERDIAFARSDLKALVTENRVALASAKTELGSKIDDNIAVIKDEQKTRATETSALAESVEALVADTGEQSAAIDEINRVEADSDSLSARALYQLQVSVQGEGGLAEAVTAVEGRVENTEEGITASISERGILRAGLVDADGAAAIADLRAALNLVDAKKYTEKGLGEARRDLSVKIKEGLSVEARKRTELTAVLDDSVARLDSGLRIRVTEHKALSESHDALRVDRDKTDAALTEFKQVVAKENLAVATSITGLSARVSDAEGNIDDILALQVGTDHVFGQWKQSIDGSVSDAVSGLVIANGRIQAIEDLNVWAGTTILTRFQNIEGVVNDPATGLNKAHARITDVETLHVADEIASAKRASLLEASVGGDLVNAVPDNQISNPDAWGIGAGWSLVNPSGNTSLDTAGCFKYTYSGGTGDSAALDSSKFAVVSGKTYSCEFQSVRLAVGQYKVSGKIRWFGDDGLWISTTSIAAVAVTTAGVHVGAKEVVAPLGAKFGQLRFTCDKTFTDVNVKIAGFRVERISDVVTKARGDILSLNDISVTSDSVLARDYYALRGDVNDPDTGLAQAHAEISNVQGLLVSPDSALGRHVARTAAQVGGDGSNAIADANINTAALWTLRTGWTLDPNTTIPGFSSSGHLKFTFSGGTGLSADADSWYFTVQPLQKWRFAYQSFAADQQYKLRGRVRWEQADGTYISGNTIFFDLAAVGVVVDHEAELTAPVGAKRALMRFTVDRDNTLTDVFVSGITAERIGSELLKTRGEVKDVVDFNLTPDSVLFQKMTSVTSEVFGADGTSGLKATVQSHSSSLDGVSLSYGFKMDNNGVVSGMIATSDLIDGTANVDSSILFATDSFQIVGEMYAVGTVNVTAGSKTVTGTATNWIGNVAMDNWFIGPDKRRIQIAQVVSATELLLKKTYKGVTDAAQTYAIAKARPVFSAINGQVFIDSAVIPKANIWDLVVGDKIETDNYQIVNGEVQSGWQIAKNGDFNRRVIVAEGVVDCAALVGIGQGVWHEFMAAEAIPTGIPYTEILADNPPDRGYIAYAQISRNNNGVLESSIHKLTSQDGTNAFWEVEGKVRALARWTGYAGINQQLHLDLKVRTKNILTVNGHASDATSTAPYKIRWRIYKIT